MDCLHGNCASLIHIDSGRDFIPLQHTLSVRSSCQFWFSRKSSVGWRVSHVHMQHGNTRHSNLTVDSIIVFCCSKPFEQQRRPERATCLLPQTHKCASSRTRSSPWLLATNSLLGAASSQKRKILDRCGNDPSAGSPTETLLRLHLPLNDKV